ncbi:MAG: hypothetical protein LBD04_06680 [Synergistaceae bacterium]|jgi:hypothetical protein|nr:hypothetical protein [Synergistaceae bacterium]
MSEKRIHYINETGRILRRRGGFEVRPLADFWTRDYEASDSGFTLLEDNTPSVAQSFEIAVTGAPTRVLIPEPKNSRYMEVTVQAKTDGSAIELGFNRASDPTAPVDAITLYRETVDTRRAYCLWLSGAGVARVIFKELLV